MVNRAQVQLPFTYAARKYGYIIWRKRNDGIVRSVFDNERFVDLLIENKLYEKKRIDWKRRRISISFSLTRSVPKSNQTIAIARDKTGKISVSFK